MHKKIKELPQVLVLKRSFVQRFPNGQQVALYHSDFLDQYVTVPLMDSQFSTTKESVIETLKRISEQDIIENIKFEDDTELNINKECADIILGSCEINDDLFLEKLISSEKSFLLILEQTIDQEVISEQELENT